MIVLGLHFGHDGSACVMKDGRLVAALASERLSRQKKSAGVPEEVLDAVLETSGVTLADVDAVAVTDWYSPWANGPYEVYAGDDGLTDPQGMPLKPGEWVHDSWDRIWDDEVRLLDVRIRGKSFRGYNVGHQKAHCASAFYTSPYDQAWCMSMDSSGAKPKNNFMVAHGDGLKLDWYDTPICMAGVLYGHFCDNLQIGAQIFKAGAMMALAGYGSVNPSVRERYDWWRKSAFFAADGDYHAWVDKAWAELSGGQTFTKETSDSPGACDIAATAQFIFEQAILYGVTQIPDDGCHNLCLSGGSFLNCNVNSAVLRETRFGNVHLFPGATDDGLSVGAALYVAHHILEEPRAKYRTGSICYLGPEQPVGALDTARVAQAIADGKVVAWFQGRSEFGPRALGHRSILADPRDAKMRDRINFKIKGREWYRPLAPAVLAEKSAQWFDHPGDSPYMLFTAQCRYPERVPSAVHIDGSARMQTVRRKDNPAFYDVIRRFDKLTGVPMVLNTSLNVDGEPIVETKEDLLRLWNSAQVDMAVYGGEIWER